MLVVCLVLALIVMAGQCAAWDYRLAAAPDGQENVTAQANPPKPIVKVKPNIVKCKPESSWSARLIPQRFLPECMLPMSAPRGWEITGEAMFARTKGNVRFYQNQVYSVSGLADVDLNSSIGLPEHMTVGTFTIKYRFQPQWSVKYSIMPMVADGGGTFGNTFVFGANTYNSSVSARSKWERTIQRAGIVYDPIRTMSSRLSISGEYVRVDDKIGVFQTSFTTSDTLNTDMNMAMVGMEFERCIKTMPSLSALSLICKAGVGFGDDSLGSDLSSGLKYSINLNNGRWGYLSGGYKYMSLKKKYSDAKSIDTAMEGGFLQLGLIF